MLKFWYSEHCTRPIKLLCCICSCLVIYFSASVAKLATLDTLYALAIGVSIHLIYLLLQWIPAVNNQRLNKWLLFSMPVLLLGYMISHFASIHRLVLSIQALGFVALGFFMVSIYSARAKRFD